MQELVLNGKTYVKATDIAKHLGYTSDYVGQLCRAGKVDAERVGRAWYVVPDTIHEHKQTRYRSNQAKSKEAVAAYRAAQHNEPASEAPRRPSHAHHLQVHHYEHDTTDLIPTPQKTSSAERVRESTTSPTESQPTLKTVKVESVAKPRTFTAEKTGEARFTGTLTIATADTEEITSTASVMPSAAHPEEATVSHQIPLRKVQTDTTPPRRGRAVAVAAPQAEVETEAAVLSIQSSERRSRSWVGRYRFTLIAGWLIFIGVLTIGVLGSEVVWQVSASSQIAMVQFDLGNITENINKYLNISFIR
jgi:hypothetical protein